MRRILFAAVAVALVSHPAAAQSNADASSAATQTTDANAANTVNVVAVAQGPTGPQQNDINYSGHTWTTPSVAGSYFGGTNPCLVGTGGGIAGGPIGFNINLGRNDEGCTRRSDAAAWHGMGFDNVAVARMCQDVLSADAFFSATGTACPGQRGERYKLADGSIAPEAVLVSNSKAVPNNPNLGLNMNDPAVQAAVKRAAEEMIRANPQAAMALAQGHQQASAAPVEPQVQMVQSPVVQPLNQ